MSRDVRLYVQDIVEECDRVAEFTTTMSLDAFLRDEKTRHAVAYALLSVGEAVKHIPADLRAREPSIEWRQIAGMRDVLAHGYYGLDLETVWQVVQLHVPALRAAAARLLAVLPDPPGSLVSDDKLRTERRSAG